MKAQSVLYKYKCPPHSSGGEDTMPVQEAFSSPGTC